MKLLRTTKKLKSVEALLGHCNLASNNYQQASKVLFTFASNKQFGQSIKISTHMLKIFNITHTKFSCIEVWFTAQNSKQLEIEDVNMTLIIG